MRWWFFGLSAALLACTRADAVDRGEMQFALKAPASSYAAGGQIVLTWELVNRTGRTWQVLASDNGCDAITLELSTAGGQRLRRFRLSVPRTAFRPEFVVLAPGGMVARSFDLLQFAQLNRVTLAAGDYVISATYGFASYSYPSDNRAIPTWPGESASPPLRLTIRPGP